jgi:hypothetical protein
MIARIKFNDSYKIAADAERLAQLREIVPIIPVPDEKDVYRWDVHKVLEDVMIDMIDQAPLLIAAGFEFTVKAFKSNYFTEIKENVARFERELKFVKAKLYDPATNVVAQVHMPNGFLHEVNEVKVFNDYCTEQLQLELKDGWRILAVCPSIEQRRPDYVLGRVKR